MLNNRLDKHAAGRVAAPSGIITVFPVLVMSGQTLYDKLWNAHVVNVEDDSTTLLAMDVASDGVTFRYQTMAATSQGLGGEQFINQIKLRMLGSASRMVPTAGTPASSARSSTVCPG